MGGDIYIHMYILYIHIYYIYEREMIDILAMTRNLVLLFLTT